MMVFYVKLAGQLIEIHAQYEMARKKLSNYIIRPDNLSLVSFTVAVSQQDMLYEEAEMQEDIWKENDMYFSRNPQLLEYAAIQRKIAIALVEYNTLVFHGSAISTNGSGVIMVGRSGIGKSERTRIWINEFPGSFVINGDKPFIRIMDNKAYAYGNPWCGKEGWNTNSSAPLNDILIIERVDEINGENNSICKISFSDAFSTIIQQVYIPNEYMAMRKVLCLLKELDGMVDFYRFRSDLSSEGIIMAYNTIM